MPPKKRKSDNPISISRAKLEKLYAYYNHKEFVHPDPLEFLYAYPDFLERELVGLIASSLAYGRVAQILKNVSYVLERMHHSPRSYLMASSREDLFSSLFGFRHRFTTGEEMAAMLLGAKNVIERYGSLYECFMAGFNDNEDTVLPALSALVGKLYETIPGEKNSLLPSPDRGSACKRLNLFLRWMVRKDRVDPGGWVGVPQSKLIIPLDTHMHKISLKLNMTKRKQAGIRTAIDITHAFRTIAPEDPVRYDFALTRLGIRKDADLELFLSQP
ncbi:TIGR02757 family protein [Thermodesulfobacteriota bacterium]